jgi:16S rRNA (adenine1518-N6/adenine1519-N6)-dimethyltransferase
MQTKHQIQYLLESEGISPDKRLGQHFLIDLNLMRLLIEAAQIGSDDVVLEVGCGTGSLTQGLSERGGEVIAVEIDENLTRIAKGQLADKKNVEIINTDVLENKNTISPVVADTIATACRRCGGRFLLVANLPYNAASAVMMNLVTGPITADAMYVTVQKEIAERMTASPGSKHYGTLSIFLAAAGDVETIRILKPTVFWPQPQVESAIIGFVRSEEKARRIKNMDIFSDVVALFMQHRRKMLKGCARLAEGELAKIDNWQEIFEKCSINPTDRPEQILVEGYIAIANLCGKLPTRRKKM